MLKAVKKFSLRSLETLGVSSILSRSRWRRDHLLILAYHGISQEDEHLWSPELYMPPEFFHRRMETIKRADCNVLPLGEAITRLYAGTLPERCVALTFDDGASDFFYRALPIIQEYGFPVTVYLTTFYCIFNRPVFKGVCSYILWKARDSTLDLAQITGQEERLDLATMKARDFALNAITEFATRHSLSAEEKDELAARLAGELNVEYDRLLAKQILHIMSLEQVKRAAAEGVDVQLHTHRHRVPLDKDLFAREVEENRQHIKDITGITATDLCYPDGLYYAEFFSWLKGMGVSSATTCEPALASASTNPMRLPRLVDTSLLSMTEFKGWISGVSDFLPRRWQPDNRPGKRRGLRRFRGGIRSISPPSCCR